MRTYVWHLGVLAATLIYPIDARPEDSTAAPAPAAKTQTPDDAALDEGLLEFLGSVDSEDGDWNEYLNKTDVSKKAKTAAPLPKSEVKKDE